MNIFVLFCILVQLYDYFFPRDFAYIHTAVYVGKVMGRHYVIENAGSGEKKREGAWLRLTGTNFVS